MEKDDTGRREIWKGEKRQREFQKRGMSLFILSYPCSVMVCTIRRETSAVTGSVTDLIGTGMTVDWTILVLLFTMESLNLFTCYPCGPQFYPYAPSTVTGSSNGFFAHIKIIALMVVSGAIVDSASSSVVVVVSNWDEICKSSWDVGIGGGGGEAALCVRVPRKDDESWRLFCVTKKGK